VASEAAISMILHLRSHSLYLDRREHPLRLAAGDRQKALS
jgi:hypothetical protein